MESFLNTDLLLVGVAVAGAGTLGFSIYFSDTKNSTSRSFLLFAIVSIFWSITNFASARATDPILLLWLIRLVLFFAIWHAFSFFILAQQFPEPKPILQKKAFLGFLSWTAIISIIALTPFVYESVVTIDSMITTKTGPGIALFGLSVFWFVGAGIWTLARKLFRSKGIERNQMEFVFTGMIMTFIFLIIFNFLFPALLNISTLVPFGGLFLLPFIVGTAYAILRYRLFDLRVALFGLLTFMLATATFFDVILANSITLVLYRVVELLLVLVAGILLIRNIIHEFRLEKELRQTNERQETLIHFIGHEVKGFLTKDMGVFAALLEGDYGTLPEELNPFVTQALAQTRQGADSVANILKAANLKKGTVTYTKEPFDLKEVVAAAVEKEKLIAERKGLTLSFTADEGGSYRMVGDKAQINDHVIRNIISNAINYTPTGSIAVSLRRDGEKVALEVKDSGIGITDEDKKKLFTEGGHGKDSIKTNVHSTGYGLYIAKQIIEAHGGTITASSEGEGKGATFVVKFPAV
ncbi:HAMP domain-containing histidine kinase [Patescibacteria group bacterium]|nr:HAMP domain-containing histidine kinase [Patescibacteria group bacterium]